ncbi:MAG TPA: GNAT family protein [Gaiellaceae bacterium]
MQLEPPGIPLRHGEALLRPWREADAGPLIAACSDPEIARWTPVPQPYTDADAIAFLARAREGWRSGSTASFAIVGAATDELLGSIELRLHGARASVGYWLGEGARGRGIATRALRLVTDWAFSSLGVTRIELTTDPENVPSQRVAERVGFRNEGVRERAIVIKGAVRDSVVFGLAA